VGLVSLCPVLVNVAAILDLIALPPHADWCIDTDQKEERSPKKSFKDFLTPNAIDNPPVSPSCCHKIK